MTTNFIGARIKALREEQKLSQDDLARLFGRRERATYIPQDNLAIIDLQDYNDLWRLS